MTQSATASKAKQWPPFPCKIGWSRFQVEPVYNPIRPGTMSLDLPSIIILLAVGVAAGMVNTMAGGGSLLMLPAFIFLGLPAPVANGTNRITVLLQSLVGARAMHRLAPFPWRRALILAVPTLFGAILGAWLATRVEADAMEQVIGGTLVFGALLLALRPGRFIEATSSEQPTGMRSALLMLALLATGFYGGFVQAGVGALFLIALAGVGRWDLLQATGAKNLIIAAYSLPALAIFALHHQVDLGAGLVAAIGSMTGATIGARLALIGGRRLILWMVIGAILIASMALLGVL